MKFFILALLVLFQWPSKGFSEGECYYTDLGDLSYSINCTTCLQYNPLYSGSYAPCPGGGNPQVCTPNSLDSVSCSVPNGAGTQSRSCNSSGSGFANYGPCVATSCNSGYALRSGACVLNQVCNPYSTDTAYCPISNGAGTKYRTCNSSGSGFGNYGACVATSCNSGYALRNGACVLNQVCAPNSVDSASCSVPNGAGTQSRSCNSSGSGFGNYGACVATSCNSGYVLRNGTCVLNQVCAPNSVDAASCSVPNGAGTQSRSCNSSGSGFGNYGACVATSCNSGYVLKNGACVAAPFPCSSQKTAAITAAANNVRNGVPSLINTLKANPPTLNEITKIIEARQQLVRDLIELEQDSSYPSEYRASLRNLIAALEYENSQALSPYRARAVMNDGPGFWTFFAEGLWDAYATKEGVHNMLGSAGMIPVAGCVFDLADSALYLYDGDNCMAATSLAFALPVVGDSASVGTKLVKGAQKVCNAIEPVCKTGVAAGRLLNPIQTATQATKAAGALGYIKTSFIGKNGAPIYKRTNKAPKNLPEYITPDWGSKNPGSTGWFSHNGGVWKGVDRDPRRLSSCDTRAGTYNEDLTVWVGK